MCLERLDNYWYIVFLMSLHHPAFRMQGNPETLYRGATSCPLVNGNGGMIQ